MVEPVRLALFGAGGIGMRHLALAEEEPECVLVAVADPLAAAAPATGRYQARFYRDYRELLAREQLDGAIVATPNDAHAEVGIACVERGLPVLVEKPITDTVASARALLAAAAQHGAPLAVGHHRRFDPAIGVARDAIRAGRIGRLAAVQCLWALRKHDAYYDAEWRRMRPSGGPALINLIHDVDLLRYLCGDVVSVYAEGGSELRGHEVEDTVAATLRFASGAVGTIVASDATPSPWSWECGTGENPLIPPTGRNCYRFLGTEGALALPRLDLWRHDDGVPASWHATIRARTLAVGPRAALKDQLRHFCAVVRRERAPRVSGEDGLRTLATTLAIIESMDRGAPIVVETLQDSDRN
ncbi:MAG: Gfo/Idh/MocA family oxidoreductase [Thiotrichales bacterium]|nr:Gfo/Idh/MocA family oxidoreductase [Thiotrichales bacterium]